LIGDLCTIDIGEIKSSDTNVQKAKKQLYERLNVLKFVMEQIYPGKTLRFTLIGRIIIPKNSRVKLADDEKDDVFFKGISYYYHYL
jgi:hypothetical protein